MFPKIPICEVCNSQPAISFSFIDGGANPGWKFTCSCAEEEMYYITFESFFSAPPSMVDWLAHMNEKTWMNWMDFMNMMDRFREATQSYGRL